MAFDPKKNRRRMLLAGLAAALVVLALALITPDDAGGDAGAGGTITAPEAHRMVQAGKVALFDVRSPGEWRATGLPAGARAVTIHNPEGMTGFLADMLAAVDGDRSRPIALICAAGGRSARAKRYLEGKGFKNVLDVSEGMLGRGGAPGWVARGLPTEPCKTC